MGQNDWGFEPCDHLRIIKLFQGAARTLCASVIAPFTTAWHFAMSVEVYTMRRGKAGNPPEWRAREFAYLKPFVE